MKKILLVEDNEAIQKGLRIFIRARKICSRTCK